MSASGLSDCEISRTLSIPRTTIREWRTGKVRQIQGRRSRRSGSLGATVCGHDFTRLPTEPFAYLLGVYLGDGCISAQPRDVWKLRLTMDVAYPGIIDECCAAMEALLPDKRANVYRLATSACVEISMYWKHWPCLIPQHGAGKKHLREIWLHQWQHRIVDAAHESFVRGLIHSDGCRVVASDRGVPSVRYHFSNLSEDIKRLYCHSLDALGIPWTRPCSNQVAVYRKTATARLDEFIGPKK